jgi:hypothetical protein
MQAKLQEWQIEDVLWRYLESRILASLSKPAAKPSMR